jgi:hypothetical protein
LTLRESNLEIAEIFIKYRLPTEFQDHPLLIEAQESIKLQEVVDQYAKNNVFLDYSAKHWGAHARLAEIEKPETVESVLELCKSPSDRFVTWFQIKWAEYRSGLCPRGFTQLMTGAYLGLAAIVRQLLMAGTELDPKDDTSQTPLSWATMKRNEAVVRLLVEAGTDLN